MEKLPRSRKGMVMAVLNTNMFYLGNFAEMDTDETDFDAEGHNLLVGTHVKPPLVSVVVNDADNDGYIFDDEAGGTPSEYLEYDLGSGSTQQQIDATLVYDAAVLLGDGSTINIPIVGVQLQNGDVFLSDYANSGSLDNRSIQSITLSNPDSLWTAFVTNSSVDNSRTVCFAPSTLLQTPHGPRRIETLRSGDLLVTRHNNVQPILAMVASPVPRRPKNQPISIARGALGLDIPSLPLIVSPQHRILASGPIVARMFGHPEVFLAAKSLLALPGVQQLPVGVVKQYHHVLCARHEIIFAQDCPVETLFSGQEALKALAGTLAGHCLATTKAKLAAPVVPIARQRKFVARCFANSKPLCTRAQSMTQVVN